MKKITTIINYCSNDYVFLKPCIDSALALSDSVIVPYCDHFLDGTPENKELINRGIKENKNAQFFEFQYSPSQTSRWHHNAARKVGISMAPQDTDYFLFLDVDEIIVPDQFKDWWSHQQYQLLTSYKLANYFYFRDVIYQAKEWQDSVVLVKKGTFTEDIFIFHENERSAFYDYVPKNERARNVIYNGKPFIHHYSWVRSKEAMIKKVTCWGHSKDRDWVSAIHEEFSVPFRGKDVILGYEYNTVDPYINISIT